VTILVAGGTGTLGSQILERLLARQFSVRVLTRDPARVHSSTGDQPEFVAGDVRDPASLRGAMRGVDTVISAVQGFVSSGGVTPASVDRDGNIHLIDAARSVGAAFVLMSVVGAAPESPLELCRMKYAAEAYLRASGLAWSIIRATTFLETWIGLLERTARGSGRPVVFGSGDNPINFVSVADVATLVERVVLDTSTRGSTLEIGGPENLTLNQLASAVQRAAKRTSQARHVPRPLLKVMSVLLRPLRPDIARQLQAALVFDTADLAFDGFSAREACPHVLGTTLSEVLDVDAALAS
jgi:uncharacterized protein YbjT (DUF2867 family)